MALGPHHVQPAGGGGRDRRGGAKHDAVLPSAVITSATQLLKAHQSSGINLLYRLLRM